MKNFGLTLMVLLSGCSGQAPEHVADDAPNAALTQAHAERAVQLSQALKQRVLTSGQHVAPAFLNPSSADLAPALPVYSVQLDELQAYSGSADVAALLHETNDRYHPVLRDGKVVAGTMLTRASAGWQPSMIEGPLVASRIQTARRRLKASGNGTDEDCSLVKVPALGLRFLMYREKDQILFTALDQATEGNARPAEAVLAELHEAARAVPL